MEDDILTQKWVYVRRDAKTMWPKITDDEWDQVKGQRQAFVMLLQRNYGLRFERAGYTVNRFLDQMARKYNH